MLESHELELYECSKRFGILSDMVKKEIQPFAPDEEHYGRDVMQALERLNVVIQVRKNSNNSDKYFAPKGSYLAREMPFYDITTTNAMRKLRVHTIKSCYQTQTIVENRSLNDELARLRQRANRYCMFQNLEKSIIQDMTWIERIDGNCYQYCQKIRDILGLLGDLVRVVNQGPDWVQLCEDRGWDSKKLTDEYDLSSNVSMSTQRIVTKGVTHASLQDLLVKINNIEKAKYFFNHVYEHVMPVVYHLQELAHEEKETIIADLVTARVTRIVGALLRLYKAIDRKYRNINDSEYYPFVSIDELLDANIDHTMSLREAILFSDDKLVQPNILLQRVSDTLNILHKNTIDFVRPLGQKYTMHSGMQTSLVVAKTLCRLVECGDLAQIRDMDPCSYNIDLLVELPMQIQFSTLYTDAMYAWTYRPSVYAGKYNALILAVLYRYTDIVRYFLEKGANPKIKGGRLHDLSAESSVTLVVPGIIKPAPPELRQLFPQLFLSKITIKGSFGKHQAFYRPIDFSDPLGTAGETSEKLPQKLKLEL